MPIARRLTKIKTFSNVCSRFVDSLSTLGVLTHPSSTEKHTLCKDTPLQNTKSNVGRERRAAHPLCPSSDSLLNFSMEGWNEWTSCTPRGKRSLESRVAHPPTATTDSVSPAAYLTSIREAHQFVLSLCFYASSPLPFSLLSSAVSIY